MNETTGLPLFDWQPSAKVEPFPFHQCRPKVRHAAFLVVENDRDRAAACLKVIEDGIRRHLASGAFGPKAIEKEIEAFRQAVSNDVNRLRYEAAAVAPDCGGAA
ncbi:DUF6074 family protein [Aurantimonas endophytica]|uniref:Uncharacterized protein n=1 Tax=Aurantimonas endophytica TaxID=1522175 RepID=A0A7W6HDN5_9HYPH|nr:DUF6074 family protein [Aurantimonas endophytica]MBB4003233.1 hypothetical protein [Aurantimonas endophytica]MCO6404095.1 hypothetical protein [Aurantimonas endophytica]